MRALLLTALLLVLTAPLRASTVTVEANDSSGFSDLTGADLQSGSVLLGTFQLANGTAMSDSAIQAFASDFSGLMSRFTRFSTTEAHIKQGSTNAGELSVQLNGTTATTPTLVGKQVYFLVISGTDNSTVATSIATVRQFGVYYLDKASANVHAADWAFPDDTDIFAQPTVDIADLTVNNAGVSLLAGGISHVVIGTFGPDHSNAHPSAFNFQLQAVPEPTAGVLGMFVAVGLLSRRRRSRRG